MTIRVLHVYRTYYPDTQGGLEEVIRQICLNAIPHGVESRVFSLSENPQPAIVTRQEAEVYRFKLTAEIASCGISISGLKHFKALVDWADVVNYHFPWPFADVLHFTAWVNKPSIVTYHSDIVRQRGLLQLYKPLMHLFLKSVDAIVATSPNYVETSPVLQSYKDKTRAIPLGLSRSSYPGLEPGVLQQVQLETGDDFIFFIGVLRYYKGLHILLKALEGTPVKCVIAGSGPEEGALKQQAAELGLDNVVFLGRIDDPKKVALLNLCRAVVFPSHLRSEAFGVTLIEGAMCGKPLISTEIGTGTSFVNRHQETGMVVSPENVEELRQAILLVMNDRQKAEQFGHAARRRFESEFTGEIMGERYARLYHDLCGQ